MMHTGRNEQQCKPQLIQAPFQESVMQSNQKYLHYILSKYLLGTSIGQISKTKWLSCALNETWNDRPSIWYLRYGEHE